MCNDLSFFEARLSVLTRMPCQQTVCATRFGLDVAVALLTAGVAKLALSSGERRISGAGMAGMASDEQAWLKMRWKEEKSGSEKGLLSRRLRKNRTEHVRLAPWRPCFLFGHRIPGHLLG